MLIDRHMLPADSFKEAFVNLSKVNSHEPQGPGSTIADLPSADQSALNQLKNKNLDFRYAPVGRYCAFHKLEECLLESRSFHSQNPF